MLAALLNLNEKCEWNTRCWIPTVLNLHRFNNLGIFKISILFLFHLDAFIMVLNGFMRIPVLAGIYIISKLQICIDQRFLCYIPMLT